MKLLHALLLFTPVVAADGCACGCAAADTAEAKTAGAAAGLAGEMVTELVEDEMAGLDRTAEEG